MKLGSFDTAAFLRDVWQRTPRLFRSPWDRWNNPITVNELAGLACEMEVESRLVLSLGGTYSLEDGPFEEERLTRLPPRDWTLLVQAVDHHVPDVAAILDAFRFIPNWRIDDVMVSGSATGGGVGAHFDHYDVFLIQGAGRRTWEIGARCDASTPLTPHDDLRLLADFTAAETYLLGPGDMLYVPPGFAHRGTADSDDCMTYSVGFRAPSRGELLGHFANDVLGNLTDDERYGDAGRAAADNPGLITDGDIDALRQIMLDTVSDRGQFAQWFARHSTTPKYPDIDYAPDEPPAGKEFRTGAAIMRNPASRFSYLNGDGGTVRMFVDGEAVPAASGADELARAICAGDVTLSAAPNAAEAELLRTLAAMGTVMLDHGD